MSPPITGTSAANDRRVFFRKPFVVPDRTDLALASARQLQQIAHSHDQVRNAGTAVLAKALGAKLDGDDPALPRATGFLSSHYPVRSHGFASCGKSMEEWRILRWAWHRLRDSLDQRDGAGFRDVLIGIAKRAGGGEGLRREEVRTCPDAAGRVVVFPHWQTIPDRLEALFRLLVADTPSAPGLDAVLALVWISHCHPFTDGNGRTSRIIFSALLQRHHDRPAFYLPIFELAALSRGLFIMSVRSAEIHGRWADLLSALARMMAYWSARVGWETCNVTDDRGGEGPDARRR
jgi:hypothetical protein